MEQQPNPYASPAAPATEQPSPNRRACYFATLLLLALAIGAQLLSMQSTSTAIQSAAQRSTASARHEVARSYMRQSSLWSTAGMTLAIIGLCLWLLSAKRREPVLHSVPLLVFVWYVLLCLLLI